MQCYESQKERETERQRQKGKWPKQRPFVSSPWVEVTLEKVASAKLTAWP